MLELAGVTAHTMFKPVAYIENTTTDTEVRRGAAGTGAGPPLRRG